jgi:ParB family transcriptional regulator, chromosome partitioning protein
MTEINQTETTEQDNRVVFVPLNKLRKSPKNARKVPHSEATIEALAASIAHKGLIQNIVIEPEMKGEQPTGFYLVTAGEGRRLAYQLRAKRKEIKKTHPVRCWLDTENDPSEISLDENVTREAMHPADQYERFHELSCIKGWGAEEIGARFGVSPDVVKRRLKLGAVSPKLIDIYRQEGMTYDQLVAFAITDDHARQEQVFANLSFNKEPWIIRRDLTADKVPADDRRAVFIGAEAYQEAGGMVLRDLFTPDDGGYFEDAGLLDTLVVERLREIAGDVLAEGWKWSEASIDFPHGHGLRRYYPQPVDLSEDDAARLDAASAEHDALVEGYTSYEDMPEDVAAKAEALCDEVDALADKRMAFDPAIIARGGAFVTLTAAGDVQIVRGFVQAEDEPQADPEPDDESAAETVEADEQDADEDDTGDSEDADPGKPISDTLIRDLTAHRTLGLRLAVDDSTSMALIVLTHAMVAQLFYRSSDRSCLDLHVKSADLSNDAEGIASTGASETLTARQDEWAQRLPSDVVDLWAFVVSLNMDDVLCLLTFCTAQTVNAVKVPWERKTRQLAAAETLAQAVDLDMTRHWTATSRTYFGRVTKAHIAAAVREAVTSEAADRIAPMKKADMADAAEQLVAQTGWLPPQMRTAKPEADPAQTEAVEPVATEGSELAIAEPVDAADEAEAPDTEAEDAEDIYAVAAE